MGAIATDATLTSFHPGSARTKPAERIASLDIARGIIMILMAIDHVRVYAGVPAGGPSPGVFFTRWVTNFSAPGFAFLAGTGAFLLGQKLGDKRALSRYLVERGIILIALELTFLRLAWTFNADVAHYNLAGVIWMLGWCMILLAGLIWLPVVAIAVVGLAIIVAPSSREIRQTLEDSVAGSHTEAPVHAPVRRSMIASAISWVKAVPPRSLVSVRPSRRTA